MKRMILDIETLAVPEDLPAGVLVDVVQVGVVLCAGHDLEIIDRRQWNVLPCGLGQDSTIRFWMKQAEKWHLPEWALARMPDRDRSPRVMGAVPMDTVLRELQVLWGVGDEKCGEVWSKGSFDVDILQTHFAACGLRPPWRYYQARDLRTLMKVCGVKGLPHGIVDHEGLADAIAETAELRECLGMIA